MSSNAENDLIRRIQESEKSCASLTEKCRLFEKQLETSESARKTEAEEAAVSKKDLDKKIRDLEIERKRLQEESESLEKAAISAHRKVSIKSIK